MPLLTLAVALALAPTSAPNTLSPEEKRQGFTLLFDGKTTAGWHCYKLTTVQDGWSAKDGTLTCRANAEADDLCTDKLFGNFELRFEWRISKGGNSGVIYRCTEDHAACWQTGPEYQVLDDAAYPETFADMTSAASCYALYGVTQKVSKPAGQWNVGRLVCKGDHVEHWLNGVKVVTFEWDSADWKKRVAASKFGNMIDFGTVKVGHLALQNHGHEVAYRSMRIRALK